MRVRSPHWLRSAGLVGLDLVALAVAHCLAFMLRYDGYLADHHFLPLLESLPLALVCMLAAFGLSGIYRMQSEFASITEMISLARASAIGGALYFQMLFLLRVPGVPRGAALLEIGLFFVLSGTVRVAPLLQREILRRPRKGLRVLVVGAGKVGETIVREMLRQPELRLLPVGFVDDARHKWQSRIRGVPVLGGPERLPGLVRQLRVQQIIIAAPSATGVQMRRLVALCQAAGVPTRTMPGLREIMDGRVDVHSVREVRIEDLLGRLPVLFDAAEVRSFLAGKRVLVTGAAGSIGSELCRQIAGWEPEGLVLLDRNENGLFYLETELRASACADRLQVAMCDITRFERLVQVLRETSPQVVFHAAAYKHVPLLERHPVEAARNNIFGTANLAEAAERCGVESFVYISTDKAVAPTSVLGASKRAAGMIIQERAPRSRTRFVTVRFGNVLGSQGSVLTVFREQIERGGPVTLTAPGMKRFFMTIPEAVQLISQAAAMGRGGEIFILEMGEPVVIEDMARDLIRLSGLEPGRDIEIRYTGARPGERLEERLWTEEERPSPTRHPRILAAQCVPVDRQRLERGLERLRSAVRQGCDADVVSVLREIVPDYVPRYCAEIPAPDGIEPDLESGAA